MPHSSKMTMNDSKLQCYSVPRMRLKNVICVACKNMFHIPDILNLNGLILKGPKIPLLLDCGHPICSKCITSMNLVKCPKCKEVIVNYDHNNQKSLFPLNLYTLGLIVSSYHNISENEDEEFQFCSTLSGQMRNIMKQGCCHECGNKVSVKCIQCTALYCHCCYAKIHGRALQNHVQIPIFDGDPNSPAAMLNSCSPTCTETLSYFCNDCNVASCSTCILRFHKVHNFMPLSEKNDALLSEFNEIYKHIENTLLRVNETSKKVKSALASNVHELQNCDAVEAGISQHFAYLHGILQSMEVRLMNQLHRRTESIKNNLKEIQIQLQSQEDSLGKMLKMAFYAKQIYDKADIQNIIKLLKDMTDLPCHLLYKDTGDNNEATFTVDNSIVTYIKNHCTIQVPATKSYSLVQTDELPENYIISPLKKKPDNIKFLTELSLIPQVTKINNVSTIKSEDQKIKSEDQKINSENKEEKDISENVVEVACVSTPSLFYVQRVASKSKFLKLEKDLTKYENERRNVESSVTFEKDDMCVAKEEKKEIKWQRGRVVATYTIDNETKYNVFFIDYGYEVRNISSSKVRDLAEHFKELPPQAIRCCLYGIVAKNGCWTQKSKNDFVKLTRESNLITMSVIESTPDVLYVDLCVYTKDNKMGPQSICNTMKMLDYARLNNSQCTTLTTTYVYIKEELQLHKATTVAISWIESPDEIYVTKLGHRRDKLSKVVNKLKEFYEKDTLAKTIDTPQKGLPCSVQLEDGTWQRGEIVDVVNEDTIQVFCVDWGCKLALNRDCLREIPRRYTSYNAQAIRISLMFIYPEIDGSWKSNAFSMLKSIFCRAKHIAAYPRSKIDDTYKGCIFCDNLDVSRLLKSAGVVKWKETKFPKRKQQLSLNRTLSLRENFNIDKDDSSDDAKDNKSVEKNEITKDPFRMEVRVQQVKTPDCIYVAQTEREKANTEMIAAMQKFYDSYCSELRDTWNEGALCAIYSAKDKSYFRAKILKIKSPNEILVFFFDMGIEETVTLKDIQVLHQQFTKEAAYSFKIKLAGIWPCGGSSTWPSLSCITLSDIIRENAFCKFYITKPLQEEVRDDVVPVELWVKQIKIPGPLAPSQVEINSINRMLVDKGVALPIKNYFAKADITLATEFKRQLECNYQLALTEGKEEDEVKWLNKVSTDLKDMNDTIMSLENDSSSHISSNDTFNDFTKICDIKKQETKLSQWLPPTEITDEVFHAISTYVDNKCVVYLHPKKSNANVLNYIESELQLYYKNEKQHIKKGKKWKEGDLCIAQYHYNKKWYRGKIVANLGNLLKVEFVDYGNVEECEMEHVTDDIRLEYIPIQCTKCVIGGLKPATASGKWLLHDLDRIHALLVDQVCKVSVLERLPTHLVVSITLLRPWKCNLLLYLTNHMDMNIKIVHEEWNYDINCFESKDITLNSTRTQEETKKISSEKTFDEIQNTTFNEHMISGNLAESSKSKLSKYNDKEISDIESMSDISLEEIFLDNQLTCSTPHNELEEFCGTYQKLTIPQEAKYIELILCCNDNPLTSFAQLGENEDAIFPNVFHKYYLQYKTIMSDLQNNACHQPLIKSFEKNTPCIAKFSDNMWYRCIITCLKKIPDTQLTRVLLVFVDYGNNEYRDLNLLFKNHDLRVPKQEWLELPAMAIKCTLWGLNFIANDINLLAPKLNTIFNQAVVARIKEINNETDLVVEIFKDKTCKELLYAHLIKEGLYQFKKSKED